MLRVIVAAALLSGVAVPALADDPQEPAGATDVWQVSRGGELYDKWWAVIEADKPDGTHPAYPATSKKTGSATWRCKECHGWDYRGADGAYGKGSHFTGIPGLRGLDGAPVAKIEAAIRGAPHGDLAKRMSDSAIAKLALFVAKGQIDTDKYIDRKTKAAKGDAAAGARYYQTICAVCHGYDGKALNFKDDDSPEYVGTIAKDNPWEALHKIRFGQPGYGMVALDALPIQTLVDILAYTQTLPAK